jgi:SNF2 family DNA or RNA helicase
VFKAACAVNSQRRWCLTGTPIQNSLDDFGALLSFLNIYPFKEKSKFDFWVTNPLKARKAHSMQKLKDLIGATCLRRTKKTLEKSCKLPERIDRIEKVRLHEKDEQLYAFFKTKCSQLAEDLSKPKISSLAGIQCKEGNLLSLINFLRLICDHGERLLPQAALNAWFARDSTLVNWQMMQSSRKSCCVCEILFEEADSIASNGHELHCQHWICVSCTIQAEGTSIGDDDCPKCANSSDCRNYSSSPNITGVDLPPSVKVEALVRNLHSEQSAETRMSSSKPVKRSQIATVFKPDESA